MDAVAVLGSGEMTPMDSSSSDWGLLADWCVIPGEEGAGRTPCTIIPFECCEWVVQRIEERVLVVAARVLICHKPSVRETVVPEVNDTTRGICGEGYTLFSPHCPLAVR